VLFLSEVAGSVEQAREVVAQVDEVMRGPVPPLVFTTAAVDEVREELLRTTAPIIDFFGLHMAHVEAQLGARGLREARRLHGVGDVRRYNDRMAAIEFAMEHDDGLGTRGLDRADVVLIAPSRCGKPPTAMYLALQHGLFVPNEPTCGFAGVGTCWKTRLPARLPVGTVGTRWSGGAPDGATAYSLRTGNSTVDGSVSALRHSLKARPGWRCGRGLGSVLRCAVRRCRFALRGHRAPAAQGSGDRVPRSVTSAARLVSSG